MSGNLYITGFMGAGKNSVGQRLAEKLNRKFVDMDCLLENHFRMPIRQVFAKYGEEGFRDAETGILSRLSRRGHLVVATGGGVPEREKNRHVMRNSGRIIYLDVELETCMERLSAEDQASRPKWQDAQSLRSLYEKRRGFYADCDLSVSGDEQEPEEVAGAILRRLFPDERFSVLLGNVECQTICTWNAPNALEAFVRGRRTVLLSDRTVAKLHLNRVSMVLDNPVVLVIPPGERSKDLRRAHRLYEEMLHHRLERGDIFIAVGGGVVTDIGAFVASTYKRGMNLILVSTTLLGCVDAAIGGKAAVNVARAKNAVGCFATPMAVILDIFSLRTLPQAGITEGLVEAYKTGLVAAPHLAAFIEEETTSLKAKDLAALSRVASLSARTKSDVVCRDFREQGLRRILNFGHTFGHAIEGWSRFRINHGRAVAAGMIVAARLSKGRGLLSETVVERITRTLRRIVRGRFIYPPVTEAWEVMRHDKKVQGGKIVFVLLEDVGRPIYVDDVSIEELGEAIEAVDSGQ